jgi:polysaccharide export outer membrane protein
MKVLCFLILLTLSCVLYSCHTQQKLSNYLENVVDTTGTLEVLPPELRIQKNDLLSIQIYSLSTDPRADEFYNLGGNSTGANASSGTGFLVDVNGNIEYPRLGLFHVEGLTKEELAAQIKKRLTEPVELLRDPTVIIRFLNLSITMLGEVSQQGSFIMPNERLTILQAIGLAGGVPRGGKKNFVRVVRKRNDKVEIGVVDLSSKDVFKSPYYYLMQNDIVLVDPTSKKAKQEDQAIVVQKISFALGLITSAAFIYNIFK